MTVKDYTFFYKTPCIQKKNSNINYICRVVDPSKKVPDLDCEVQYLLLEVVDLK